MYRQNWKGRKKDPVGGTGRRVSLILLLSRTLVVCGILGLAISAWQQQASERTDGELRALYRTAAPGTEAPADTPAPAPSPAPSPESEPSPEREPSPETEPAPAGEPVPETGPAPTAEAAPAATPVPRLDTAIYPDNPGRKVSDRFRALKDRNGDIIGWLTIGSMVDEAVVQRDNVFYMDHNAAKEQDLSGALFLDENISLETRPYTLVLYGHNMKTGTRFGSLRNFENSGFYRSYPFIRFDTQYEDGDYVIFSEGIISTEEGDPHYLDLFALTSRLLEERTKALETLGAVSVLSSAVDVRADDQVLVLVTCVQKEEERRIVAARRFRDGESRQGLKKLVEAGKAKAPD